MLICPGNPGLGFDLPQTGRRDDSYRNHEFVGMLVSVFTGHVDKQLVQEACGTVTTRDEMVDFVAAKINGFERSRIRRIVDLVTGTYQFDYTFDELTRVKVSCPVLVVKAAGDHYSSVEKVVSAKGLDFQQRHA